MDVNVQVLSILIAHLLYKMRQSRTQTKELWIQILINLSHPLVHYKWANILEFLSEILDFSKYQNNWQSMTFFWKLWHFVKAFNEFIILN